MKFLIGSFIFALCFIAACLILSSCNSTPVPDSPRPDEVIHFQELPQCSRTTALEWNTKKAFARWHTTSATSTTYHFEDGSIATELSYNLLPITGKSKEVSPSSGYKGGDCIGDMTVVVRCRSKETLVITGVPSCVMVTFSPETQCVTFEGLSCSCGARTACCGSR